MTSCRYIPSLRDGDDPESRAPVEREVLDDFHSFRNDRGRAAEDEDPAVFSKTAIAYRLENRVVLRHIDPLQSGTGGECVVTDLDAY